jgi:hypothetical protein
LRKYGNAIADASCGVECCGFHVAQASSPVMIADDAVWFTRHGSGRSIILAVPSRKTTMTRLFLTASSFAAMCAITVATVATDTVSIARAGTPALSAPIDVYKDAN